MSKKMVIKYMIKNFDKVKAMAMLILILTICVEQCSSAAGTSANLTKLNNGGDQILSLVQGIGFWIVSIKCSFDLIKTLFTERNFHEAGQVFISYILIYAALFFVPSALHMVEGLF